MRIRMLQVRRRLDAFSASRDASVIATVILEMAALFTVAMVLGIAALDLAASSTLLVSPRPGDFRVATIAAIIFLIFFTYAVLYRLHISGEQLLGINTLMLRMLAYGAAVYTANVTNEIPVWVLLNPLRTVILTHGLDLVMEMALVAFFCDAMHWRAIPKRVVLLAMVAGVLLQYIGIFTGSLAVLVLACIFIIAPQLLVIAALFVQAHQAWLSVPAWITQAQRRPTLAPSATAARKPGRTTLHRKPHMCITKSTLLMTLVLTVGLNVVITLRLTTAVDSQIIDRWPDLEGIEGFLRVAYAVVIPGLLSVSNLCFLQYNSNLRAIVEREKLQALFIRWLFHSVRQPLGVVTGSLAEAADSLVVLQAQLAAKKQHDVASSLPFSRAGSRPGALGATALAAGAAGGAAAVAALQHRPTGRPPILPAAAALARHEGSPQTISVRVPSSSCDDAYPGRSSLERCYDTRSLPDTALFTPARHQPSLETINKVPSVYTTDVRAGHGAPEIPGIAVQPPVGVFPSSALASKLAMCSSADAQAQHRADVQSLGSPVLADASPEPVNAQAALRRLHKQLSHAEAAPLELGRRSPRRTNLAKASARLRVAAREGSGFEAQPGSGPHSLEPRRASDVTTSCHAPSVLDSVPEYPPRHEQPPLLPVFKPPGVLPSKRLMPAPKPAPQLAQSSGATSTALQSSHTPGSVVLNDMFEMMDISLEFASRIEKFLDSVKDFALCASPTESLTFGPVNITELYHDLLREFGPKFAKKRVRLVVQLWAPLHLEGAGFPAEDLEDHSARTDEAVTWGTGVWSQAADRYGPGLRGSLSSMTPSPGSSVEECGVPTPPGPVADELQAVALHLLRSAEPVWVWADKQRLQHAMAVMLRNSLDFTPAGSMVEVSMRERPSTISMTHASSLAAFSAWRPGTATELTNHSLSDILRDQAIAVQRQLAMALYAQETSTSVSTRLSRAQAEELSGNTARDMQSTPQQRTDLRRSSFPTLASRAGAVGGSTSASTSRTEPREQRASRPVCTLRSIAQRVHRALTGLGHWVVRSLLDLSTLSVADFNEAATVSSGPDPLAARVSQASGSTSIALIPTMPATPLPEVPSARRAHTRRAHHTRQQDRSKVPDESSVQAIVAQRMRSVEFTVRDHGQGLSEAGVAALFDPFQHLKPGADTCGLSFVIASTTVAKHGGRMTVNSAGEGHGLSASFTIPFVQATAAQAAGSAYPSTLQHLAQGSDAFSSNASPAHFPGRTSTSPGPYAAHPPATGGPSRVAGLSTHSRTCNRQPSAAGLSLPRAATGPSVPAISRDTSGALVPNTPHTAMSRVQVTQPESVPGAASEARQRLDRFQKQRARAIDAIDMSTVSAVLVVDDVASQRRILKRLLAKVGVPVIHEATNGEEAVRMVENGPHLQYYSAISMDSEMPVMKGGEATRRLRALGYQGRIIAATANAVARDQENFLRCGADTVLIKPLDPVKFLQAVSGVQRVPGQQLAGPAKQSTTVAFGPSCSDGSRSSHGQSTQYARSLDV